MKMWGGKGGGGSLTHLPSTKKESAMEEEKEDSILTHNAG